MASRWWVRRAEGRCNVKLTEAAEEELEAKRRALCALNAQRVPARTDLKVQQGTDGSRQRSKVRPVFERLLR